MMHVSAICDISLWQSEVVKANQNQENTIKVTY